MRIILKKFFSGENVSQSVDYSFDLSHVEIDGAYPFISPVKAKGEIKSFAGSAELEVELSFDFQMPCHRCMEETLTKWNLKVSHTLVRSLSEEKTNSKLEDKYIEVENQEIDLDELFYADILLQLPVKYVCKEDCKGLCSMCGKNLNTETCNCSRSQIDPRLEVLKQLIE